ncbi:MAG: F0F1 ATP synthase subunit B [Chloroflexota bacterium]
MNPVSVNITFVFQIISFLIVLYFINRWLAKPVTKVMVERQTRVREALAAADRAREEAAAQHQQQIEEFNVARAEAQALLASARAAADKMGEERLVQARAEADRLVEQARRAIAQEREQTKQELRAYVVDLTIEASRRVIGATLDLGGQHELIVNTVDDVFANGRDAAARANGATPRA